MACNDNAIGAQSEITLPGVAGEVYYVQISGAGGATTCRTSSPSSR